MSKMLLLMLLGVPTIAGATTTRAKAAADARAQVHYDFDDDVVEGGTLQPDGLLVGSRRPIKQSSLIKIRESFTPELIKSAEDL